MEIYNEIMRLFSDEINILYNLSYFENKLIVDSEFGLKIIDDEEKMSFIELDKHTIYLIIDNKYYSHFWHYNLEVILHLQLYLNHFKNKILMNEYHIKLITRPDVMSKYFGNVYQILNEDQIVFVEPSKCYKGTFFNFSRFGFGTTLQDDWPLPDISRYIKNNPESIYGKFCLSIYDNLIEESNKRYKETETFDKLWISRRNFDIKTYWHKRFITNLNYVASEILKNGFKEIHFPIEDIYHQIHLVNNSNVIFSELGTSTVNIFFMKKGSIYITDYDPNTRAYNDYIKLIANLRGVELLVYDKMINDDEVEKFYNLKKALEGEVDINFPYKFEDTEDFKFWFDNVLKRL